MPVTEKSQRILILRGGAIGDFVLTSPVFHSLRAKWPEARVTLACFPRVAGLALACGLADEVKSLESADVARLFTANARLSPEQSLRMDSYDVVISYLHDPDGLVRANLLGAGAERVICCSPLVGSGHAADWLMRPLGELGIIPVRPAIPRLRLAESYLPATRNGINRRGGIAIHPGSGSPKKNWPAVKLAALANRLRDEAALSPFFLFGEADSTVRDALTAIARDIPAIADRDLVEIAAILADCGGYVGNDSGITHLASALGIPVTALFGPTDPAAWGPRGDNVRIIKSDKPTTESLAEIETDVVFRQVVGHLSGR